MHFVKKKDSVAGCAGAEGGERFGQCPCKNEVAVHFWRELLLEQLEVFGTNVY